MSAAELITDLARSGIRIEAHGDRLRYSPRSAVTPDLARRMKVHKFELLSLLRHSTDVGTPPIDLRCKRCGATEYRDTPIHEGRSLRRDCARCGRFHGFPKWYDVECPGDRRPNQNHEGR